LSKEEEIKVLKRKKTQARNQDEFQRIEKRINQLEKEIREQSQRKKEKIGKEPSK
jgi:F0F1-type ATP synthase epsilon subunit